MSRTSHVIFQFRHPAVTLGLDVGVGSQEARQLTAQVREGDTLTIYYDASGTLLRQKVNLHSYQVELTGKKLLYPLAEMHRRYWLHAMLYGVVALLFAANTLTNNSKS
jgi:hypothetical protein